MHGFTEDAMPKIERSVDYTFEAYSGDGEQELKSTSKLSDMDYQTDNMGTVEDSSDVDNTSKYRIDQFFKYSITSL